MKSTVYLFKLCGVLSALLVITAACSSSREANRDDDGSDGGSLSDDGGTSKKLDGGEDDKDDEDDPPTKKSTGGNGGSSGSTGGDGPYEADASDGVRCDDDGYCYWPDGHFCDPWGMCCYPDGHCEEEGTVVGGSSGIGGIAGIGGGVIYPPFDPGGMGGNVIDPDDFTDEPWDPPIDDLAEPNWKSSGDPLCTEIQMNVMQPSVWSDSRGVFVAVSGSNNGDYYYDYEDSIVPISISGSMRPISIDPVFGTCVGEGCPRAEIYFNDGNGWDSVYKKENIPDYGWGDVNLTGFENGPLVIYGYQEMVFESGPSSGCGLATIENGVMTCEPIYYVDDLFIVDNNLAFGVYDGDIIRYDGNSWGPLPGSFTENWINQIWANETHLVGTMGGAGRIVVMHDGVWELMDTQTLREFSSIWGFSETDLWAGTYDGKIYHCDAEGCSEIPWQGDSCEYDSNIRELWGSDGVVYFYTNSTIARVVDSEVEVLASFPCPDYEIFYEQTTRVTSMWGNGPNEVFFAIVDESFPRRECGVVYVLWFDGNDFHQI